MSNIYETSFGTLVDANRIANGSASDIQKKGGSSLPLSLLTFISF